MIAIQFISDFATKKAGEKWKCDSMLANQLVRVQKVAQYVAESDIPIEKQKKLNNLKSRK
jgi:hypothetical protein